MMVWWYILELCVAKEDATLDGVKNGLIMCAEVQGCVKVVWRWHQYFSWLVGIPHRHELSVTWEMETCAENNTKPIQVKAT